MERSIGNSDFVPEANKRASDLYQERISLNNLPKPPIEIIQQLVGKWRKGYSAKAFVSAAVGSSGLAGLKTASSPMLCARIIKGSSDDMFGFLENRPSTKRFDFMLLFDAATGIELVADCLMLAEDAIAGKADEVALELGAYVHEGNGLTPSQREGLIIMLARRDSLARKSALLLKQDSTGFSLVDSILSGIRGEEKALLKDELITPEDSNLIREFMAEGVQTAVELYKQLYPLCPPPPPTPRS